MYDRVDRSNSLTVRSNDDEYSSLVPRRKAIDCGRGRGQCALSSARLEREVREKGTHPDYVLVSTKPSQPLAAVALDVPAADDLVPPRAREDAPVVADGEVEDLVRMALGDLLAFALLRRRRRAGVKALVLLGVALLRLGERLLHVGGARDARLVDGVGVGVGGGGGGGRGGGGDGAERVLENGAVLARGVEPLAVVRGDGGSDRAAVALGRRAEDGRGRDGELELQAEEEA